MDKNNKAIYFVVTLLLCLYQQELNKLIFICKNLFRKASISQLDFYNMCGGVQYHEHKIYFPQPAARLPVKLRRGGITWVTWGRRQKEAIGKFPNGGWARLDSINGSPGIRSQF